MNITFRFDPQPKAFFCTKCGKVNPKHLRNPNQWKKYSRNNDDTISACCNAKAVIRPLSWKLGDK